MVVLYEGSTVWLIVCGNVVLFSIFRCQFVHDLASILATVPLESLVKPKLPQTTISGHFDRLLNKKQIASLEDKLKVIAEPLTIS